MNGNPFFLQPADYSQSLNQAAGLVDKFGAIRQQKQQQQQQQARRQELKDIVAGGDLTKVSDFMLANPDMATNVQRNMFAAIGMKNQDHKDKLGKATFGMLSDFGHAGETLGYAIEHGKQNGEDTTHYEQELAEYKQDPVAFKRSLEGLASSMFPEKYKSWHGAMTEDEAPEKRLFKVISNDDGTTTKIYADGTQEETAARKKQNGEQVKPQMTQEKALSIVDKAKEGQLKNAGFAITMNDSLKQTRELEGGGYDPKSASWIQSALGGTTLGNIVMSEKDQLYVGAVERMINAIARRESGAAIGDDEVKNFMKRYMPMGGDTDARIKQKKRALERQFKSIRGQSGSVYDAIRLTQNMGDDKPQSSQPKQQQQEQQSIASGTVEGGYTFNGGDPADPSNWSKS